jgi:hypothetical protein
VSEFPGVSYARLQNELWCVTNLIHHMEIFLNEVDESKAGDIRHNLACMQTIKEEIEKEIVSRNSDANNFVSDETPNTGHK